MVIALVILFLLVVGICILWVRGIDHMYKYHRDYNGYDLFDEDETHYKK
jgi:hypothetical protein